MQSITIRFFFKATCDKLHTIGFDTLDEYLDWKDQMRSDIEVFSENTIRCVGCE